MVGLLQVAGCAAPATDSTADVDPGPIEHIFSFVILADPHVTADDDNAARLRTAVDWIDTQDLQLVLIVGDIAWDGGFSTARSILDTLSVTWVPILGDNEVQFGDEAEFDTAFADHFDDLPSRVDNFSRGATPVDNPQIVGESWLQNLSFDLGGVHFVGLDWCTRTVGGLAGEMADLHDFDGGSLRWLATDLGALGDGPTDRVVFASHHPMHTSPGAFTTEETVALDGLLSTWDDAVYAGFAGHYHLNGDEVYDDRPLDVYVTDATWDDALTLRVVRVSGNAETFVYDHEIVELD